MRDLISIIMPAYNATRYIALSVESVTNQTYVDWELIIFDDGSTDETSLVAHNLAASDNRIKVVSSHNLGQGRARNAALHYAQGEWVAFLDADDLWVEGKLSQQLQAARRTGADVLFSDGWVFVEDDVQDESRAFGTISGRFSGSEMFRLLYAKNRIPMPSVLARRKALDAVGLFGGDERWNRNCEDYELWLNLAEYGAVFYGMSEKLMRYRHRQDSASSGRKGFGDDAEIRWHNSRSLKAMIAVCDKYSHSILITPEEARLRLRDLHRELLATLLGENKTSEARQCLSQLRRLEGWGLRSTAQYALTYFAPNWYNIARSYLRYMRHGSHDLTARN